MDALRHSLAAPLSSPPPPFCSVGLALRQYTYFNLSRSARVAWKAMLSTLAGAADLTLSLFIGFALVDYLGKPWAWDWPLIGVAPLLLLLTRAMAMLPCTATMDHCSRKRRPPLPARIKGALCLAGVRGVVPFALAIKLDDFRESEKVIAAAGHLSERETAARLVTSALWLIFVTNLLLPPLIQLLLLRYPRVLGGGRELQFTADDFLVCPLTLPEEPGCCNARTLPITTTLNSTACAPPVPVPMLVSASAGHSCRGDATAVCGTLLHDGPEKGSSHVESCTIVEGVRTRRKSWSLGEIEERLLQPLFCKRATHSAASHVEEGSSSGSESD